MTRPPEPARRRPRRALALVALALALAVVLALPGPAAAVDVSLGLQGGLYSPRSSLGERTDGAFGSPVLDLQAGPFGVTIKYIHARYDTTFDERRSFDLTDLTQGFVQGLDVVSGIDGESERHDIDLVARYRQTPIDDLPLSLTVFGGLRYELQALDGDIANAAALVGVEPGFEEIFTSFFPSPSATIESEFSIVAVPLGVGLNYVVPDVGLSPFVTATLFPFARVGFSETRSEGYTANFPFPEPNAATARQGQQGFGGWALELGLAYSLFVPLEVPASLTLSYRWQELEPGDFTDELQQLSFGLFWHFLDVL